jgi:hypothetical protein
MITLFIYILTTAFHLYITNQRIRWKWNNFQEVFCSCESLEDGHRSGPKHVVEVIYIKLKILVRTEVCKKCLIGTCATGCITQKLRLFKDGFRRSGIYLVNLASTVIFGF